MLLESAARTALCAVNLLERRLSIVLFHHVLEQPDPLLPDEPDIEAFSRQIAWLKKSYRFYRVSDAARLLAAGKLPTRALCVTFDDGYRDNALFALPVLQEHGVAATFFVTTGYRHEGMMWNDRVIAAIRAWPTPSMDLREFGLGIVELAGDRSATVAALLPKVKYLPAAEREAVADTLFRASGAPTVRVMMSADEIRRLHDAGMEIGGHTENHPILATLSDAEAEAQIAHNKATLEDILGEHLSAFAYPNGQPGRDYDARHVAMVRRCGYRYALTTAAGTASRTADPFQLPRFTPWDRTEARYTARMAMNHLRRAPRVSPAPG
jgi:peptidoglycan/xylan/chitin deacetylase (PgdA/CDA1 family)